MTLSPRLARSPWHQQGQRSEAESQQRAHCDCLQYRLECGSNRYKRYQGIARQIAEAELIPFRLEAIDQEPVAARLSKSRFLS